MVRLFLKFYGVLIATLDREYARNLWGLFAARRGEPG